MISCVSAFATTQQQSLDGLTFITANTIGHTVPRVLRPALRPPDHTGRRVLVLLLTHLRVLGGDMTAQLRPAADVGPDTLAFAVRPTPHTLE